MGVSTNIFKILIFFLTLTQNCFSNTMILDSERSNEYVHGYNNVFIVLYDVCVHDQ